ncbi:MAG TPA: hypothetical protein VFV75_14855 [Candidatus Polarisedimenticolaceae bacterium]|nr:hypothetical protein [Candidatus Polarisedimenticolaceae bacterium]
MIWERVAQVLLAKGRISRSQLVEARRTQGFFGGRLVGHLLRLGYVDEPALGEALTEVFGVPFADAARFQNLPDELRTVLPDALVERHRVFPLRLQGNHLAVAMADPRERTVIKELEAASGRTVEPWIAAEHRLAVALERHYRIRPAKERAISVSVSGAPAPLLPLEEEPDPAEDVLDLELGLDGRPLHADVDPFDPGLEFRDLGLELPPPPPPTAAPAPVTLALEMDVLEEALLAATDRDGLATALLDFCTSRMRRAALFAVSRDAIRGVLGRGRGLEPERVRAVTLPRGGASILDTALASKDFYFGVVPKLPANHDLYSVLGGTLPSAALVLPVLVKGRVAALLYLDEGERPLTRPDIPLMRRVAAKAGLALELLLLRQKLREI